MRVNKCRVVKSCCKLLELGRCIGFAYRQISIVMPISVFKDEPSKTLVSQQSTPLLLFRLAQKYRSKTVENSSKITNIMMIATAAIMIKKVKREKKNNNKNNKNNNDNSSSSSNNNKNNNNNNNNNNKEEEEEEAEEKVSVLNHDFRFLLASL